MGPTVPKVLQRQEAQRSVSRREQSAEVRGGGQSGVLPLSSHQNPLDTYQARL